VAGAATLLTAAAAVGAQRAATPDVAFTGRYAVTFRVTNAKNFTPTRWIFGVTKPCNSPCRSVSFHQRLVSEKGWRSFVLTYTWRGAGYSLTPRVQRGLSDCRGAGGATVRKGYDVTSTQTLRMTNATNGRVVRFIGTGKDVYIPNAAGRKRGCVTGTYVFAITGATL
jgi:hypothetical protein